MTSSALVDTGADLAGRPLQDPARSRRLLRHDRLAAVGRGARGYPRADPIGRVARLAGNDAGRHGAVARRGKTMMDCHRFVLAPGATSEGAYRPRRRGIHPCAVGSAGVGARQRPVLRSFARRFSSILKAAAIILAQSSRWRNHIALDQYAADILSPAQYRLSPCLFYRTGRENEFRR